MFFGWVLNPEKPNIMPVPMKADKIAIGAYQKLRSSLNTAKCKIGTNAPIIKNKDRYILNILIVFSLKLML